MVEIIIPNQEIKGKTVHSENDPQHQINVPE